jgi:hypothetical protein
MPRGTVVDDDDDDKDVDGDDDEPDPLHPRRFACARNKVEWWATAAAPHSSSKVDRSSQLLFRLPPFPLLTLRTVVLVVALAMSPASALAPAAPADEESSPAGGFRSRAWNSLME